MKTIGEVIREARERKKLSLYAIEQKTKIKKEFVAAIEAEKWEKLPEYPVVIGFVKSLAGVLGISERQVVAVLRRDYPPKSLTVNPKPDVVREFVWSPRLTFYLGVGIIVILTVGYLAFQYKKFVSPPDLVVYEPRQEQVVKTGDLEVAGKTDPDAVVKVNNQPFLVSEDGKFDGKVPVYEGTTEVAVKAISRSGRETDVSVKIKPELK